MGYLYDRNIITATGGIFRSNGQWEFDHRSFERTCRRHQYCADRISAEFRLFVHRVYRNIRKYDKRTWRRYQDDSVCDHIYGHDGRCAGRRLYFHRDECADDQHPRQASTEKHLW